MWDRLRREFGWSFGSRVWCIDFIITYNLSLVNKVFVVCFSVPRVTLSETKESQCSAVTTSRLHSGDSAKALNKCRHAVCDWKVKKNKNLLKYLRPSWLLQKKSCKCCAENY